MPKLLINIDGENIAVSTLAIGPTTAKVTDAVIMASFVHKSGGDIHFNTVSDPTAAGITGDFPAVATDKWEVWGHDEVLTFRMIKQTSESDAVVVVQYYGDGRA